MCYDHGIGVAKDHTKAVEWYQKAAAANQDSGLYNLGIGPLLWPARTSVSKPQSVVMAGVCYLAGRGVTKNAEKAVECFQRAAEQNLSNALYALGMCTL